MKTRTDSKHHFINGAIATVLLAASMSLPTLSMAEDDSSSGSVSRERLVHKFDVNGDGTLNDREKYHARKFLARLHQNDNNRPTDRQIQRRFQRPVTNR